VASGSPYLTIEESAAVLRVSERTVRRWVSRGVLAAWKVGGTVRVRREAVTGRAIGSSRPRRGRPPKKAVPTSVSALSDDVFARTWDNPEDAVYDRWHEIYGLHEG
jgi:excisionase family DNA binding protein